MLVQVVPNSKYMSMVPDSAMADDLADTGVVVGGDSAVVMGDVGVGIKSVGVVTKVNLLSTTFPHCPSPASHH